jgi:CBS domain-containing membrane protein
LNIRLGGTLWETVPIGCLHPAGGEPIMSAAIVRGTIRAADYDFAFALVFIGSIMRVLLARFFHRLSGHSHPHQPRLPPESFGIGGEFNFAAVAG